MADRKAFTPRHAVTHEMTDRGPEIVADQIVTAEADQRPKPRRIAKPKRSAAEAADAEPSSAAEQQADQAEPGAAATEAKGE